MPIKTTDFRFQGRSLASDFGQFTHSVYRLLNGAIKPLRIVEQNESNIYKLL